MTLLPRRARLAAEGPTCEAGTVSGGQEIVEFLQLIQRLQLERMAASPDATDAAGDFVVLNNRGYNYGPAGVALPESDRAREPLSPPTPARFSRRPAIPPQPVSLARSRLRPRSAGPARTGPAVRNAG